MIRKAVENALVAAVLGANWLPTAVLRGGESANLAISQSGLEQKLHGTWKGGPCMGTITFKADGTFERREYSPGGNQLKGLWHVRWDALPPTLVLDCKESDSEHFAGKKDEPKLLVLTDTHIRLFYVGEKSTWPAGDLQAIIDGSSVYERKAEERK
jgi:hypothetical protein